MGLSAEELFFAYSSFVNLLFAAILLRSARRPLNAALGAVFLLNGLIASAAFLRLAFGTTGSSLFVEVDNLLEPLTTAAILAAALMFPRPVTPTRPWLAGILLAAGATLFVGIGLVHPEWVLAGRQPGRVLGLGTFLYGYAVQQAAWIAVLWRWGKFAVAEPSPALRRQTQLVLGAFGMRAVHVTLLVFVVDIQSPRVLTNPYGWLVIGLEVATLVAALSCVLRLVKGRAVLARTDKTILQVVFLLFAFGALEALFTFQAVIDRVYFIKPLSQFDVLALRPIIIYYAIVRYDLASSRRFLEPLGLFTIAALIGVATWFGVAADAAAPWLPWVVALGAGSAGVLLMRPLVLNLRGDLPAISYESAAASFRASAGRLEVLRKRLGLAAAHATVLRRGAADNWNGEGTEWAPGRLILGRYLLGDSLGEGGSGTVHRAIDVADGREVVLKRSQSVDREARKMLRHEATILMGLQHPNVVPVIRIEALQGEPIVVLAYAPGGSLQTRLMKRGKLSAAETRSIAQGLAAALDATHRHGIVHGDVTPANVLFAPEGHVWLSDFGASHGVSASLASAPQGTPRYLAPEQREGRVSSRESDVYAWALLVVHMATGVPPWPGQTNEDLLKRAIAVPAALRKTVGEALDANPRQRPQLLA